MRMERNLVSLRDRSGPDFERWAKHVARGVIRTVRGVDAVRDEA
jgi:hypothetical protein